jgi:hypothetical protein
MGYEVGRAARDRCRRGITLAFLADALLTPALIARATRGTTRLRVSSCGAGEVYQPN